MRGGFMRDSSKKTVEESPPLPRIRRRFRKDSIFRFYLVVFAFFCVLGLYTCVRAQGAANARLVSSLEGRIAELEARAVLEAPSSSVESPANPSESDEQKTESSSRPLPHSRYTASELFWIEGHGYNKRYAYLDLVFFDGYRARYYFRPYPSSTELANLHKRIQHDALCHYDFLLDSEDDI